MMKRMYGCPDCDPMLDNPIWTEANQREKAAFHSVHCENSQRRDDMNAAHKLASEMQAAILEMEFSKREITAKKR